MTTAGGGGGRPRWPPGSVIASGHRANGSASRLFKLHRTPPVFGGVPGKLNNSEGFDVGPRDSTMLHGLDPIAYLSGGTQPGVPPEDRTAGPTPWTTCPASAA